MGLASLILVQLFAQAGGVDDDFSPGLFFGVIFFGVILLVLIGVGIVVGLVCLACAATLAVLGVVSSSAVIAIVNRRFSTGLRALHYQFLALVGLPCGIILFWFGCVLFQVHIRSLHILLAGSGIGVLAGLVIAFVFDRLFRFAVSRIRGRLPGNPRVIEVSR